MICCFVNEWDKPKCGEQVKLSISGGMPMKRVLTLFLVLICMLSIVACDKATKFISGEC